METTLTIFLPHEKTTYLTTKLGEEKAKIISRGEANAEIEIKISSGLDVIDIFYSGVYAGMDVMKKSIK
jgi:hypothetical protein